MNDIKEKKTLKFKNNLKTKNCNLKNFTMEIKIDLTINLFKAKHKLSKNNIASTQKIYSIS